MKKFASLATVAAISLLPLSTFAQTFSQATCEQEYSYVGGYTLSIQVLDGQAKELSVNISHHKGPDSDGEVEAHRIELAKTTSAGSTSVLSYTLPTGTLQLNPVANAGTLTSVRGTVQLECKFKTVTRSAGLATRSCVNELDSSKNLKALDTNGSYFRGFAAGSYNEAGNPASIVLETQKEVYFYAGTSDISAALYVCDKATSTVKELIQSHSVDCSDLPKVSLKDVLYNDCKLTSDWND